MKSCFPICSLWRIWHMCRQEHFLISIEFSFSSSKNFLHFIKINCFSTYQISISLWKYSISFTLSFDISNKESFNWFYQIVLTKQTDCFHLLHFVMWKRQTEKMKRQPAFSWAMYTWQSAFWRTKRLIVLPGMGVEVMKWDECSVHDDDDDDANAELLFMW